MRSVPLLALDGVRFALSTLDSKAEEVKDKIKRAEQLTIAATYPGLAKQVFGPKTKVILSGGGLEALPKLMPELDGTFDLVESGQTAKENDLIVVADNLVPVTLDLLWSKSSASLIQSNIKD